MAAARLDSAVDPHQLPPVGSVVIPQLVNTGEVRDEPLLGSFLYLAGPGDFPDGALVLPWDENGASVTGRLAEKRGVENAGRLIASAKSWLCHAGVDRRGAILPAAAPEGVQKISPVAASRAYLEHLRHAWNAKHPDALFEQQQVLVTVPASFDAVARELTLHAAEEAGYRDLILLEEPQAAFYAWIERHANWRDKVRPGDLVLVADVGGGTTDFTLIAVSEEAGELKLERVAVGEHILAGGDNMDLALARTLEATLASKGTRLDAIQFHTLWQRARAAKEAILSDAKVKDQSVVIPGRGTGLVGGTIKLKLERAEVERLLVDGFFPVVESTEMPARQRRAAVQEIGLPYAADPAITRHLARFLRQPAAIAEHGALRRSASGLAAPTHVLFNGGVFRAPALRGRLLDVLNQWLRAESMNDAVVLEGDDLMHAVARGAAYYGLAREGRGVRIRGGIARTYYVGIETAMPAVPGMRPPIKALAVAPFGMEEGTEVRVPSQEFGLWVGEPAEFRFFASAVRKNDTAGAVIEDVGGDLEELSPIEVTLPAGDGTGAQVPVTFETAVTETGLLQLWCVSRDGRRWKLEFNVRERIA